MNFDDSLFEEDQSVTKKTTKKEKKKQCPYSVKLQDFRWFLSENSNTDRTGAIERLKYRADYYYAQQKYDEAMKCYEQLLPLIPPSNTVLTQEVDESRLICSTKLAENKNVGCKNTESRPSNPELV